MRRRYVRFAFVIAFGGAVAASSAMALDPPQHPNKQQQKNGDKKQVEPAKPAVKAVPEERVDQRIDRRDSRMKERDREIDRMLNKQRK